MSTDKEDDTNIKICDFGCARYVTEGPNPLKTLAGSPEYAAPEVYEHSQAGGYDEKCDLWSAGVVIYVMLCGYVPFDAPPNELPELITEGYIEFHEDSQWKHIDQPPKDLILSLLQVTPDDRASLEEALDCEWLKRYKAGTNRRSFMDRHSSLGNLGRVLRMFDSEDEDDDAKNL